MHNAQQHLRENNQNIINENNLLIIHKNPLICSIILCIVHY
ncbi:hypothetical protein CNEO4_1670049 [Clostridium neonatale]|uniref:Uncharacterized protein n=1 Tax=Clostridium neonatale TaxID=137838 RepID=A0AA86MR64_9CLOT|nr:hypothetical protein CNEO_41008 [Clostridium neonatale]CAG9712712.1 hypothetical protein CNEO_490039 [Clostridium neonatale]CAI3203282.1 hypothetical protein CNEO2_230009 [Clostridium neonatale]CAI3204163.1 hypothetical protein CNEO2_360010 [Clostridium neonatale]CAI3230381.1 hypothetical protein CNEO2_190040 [Clostridium neonatale]